MFNQGTGIQDLANNLAIWAQNGTNIGHVQICCPFILAHRAKINRKRILKSSRFVPFGANLTKFVWNPDICVPCLSCQAEMLVHQKEEELEEMKAMLAKVINKAGVRTREEVATHWPRMGGIYQGFILKSLSAQKGMSNEHTYICKWFQTLMNPLHFLVTPKSINFLYQLLDNRINLD